MFVQSLLNFVKMEFYLKNGIVFLYLKLQFGGYKMCIKCQEKHGRRFWTSK